MRDPLPIGGLALVAVAAAAVPYRWPETAVVGTGVLVLVLAGLAAVPLLGWLRTAFLGVPAAAGAGGHVAAVLLGAAGQSTPVAAVAGAAAGAAVAVGCLLVVWRSPARGLPWTSLVATALVWGLVLPRFRPGPFAPPNLFGVDLSQPRTVYLLALGLTVAGVLAVRNLARSPHGIAAAVYGAAPDLARRSGVAASRQWLTATALAGALAGAAGFVLTLQSALPPVPADFSPAVALTWLGVAVLGGTRVASGPVLGALVVGVALPAIGVPVAVAGPLALAVAVAVRPEGLLAPPHAQRRRAS